MIILFTVIKIKYVTGYITLKGGHRVGIAGNVVIKDGRVINISYISSLNFRIAKQILGASNKIIKSIIKDPYQIYNTLIISSPGVGKTTILRDLIRNLSNGSKSMEFNGMTIGIADERGEIAAMYRGIPQNDVGIRTDILDGLPKALGMKMLIRSMSPKVITADEIGNLEDVEAIKYAVCCGVKGIFTAHGSSIDDIKMNPYLKSLIDGFYFERIIVLSDRLEKCGIERIYRFDKEERRYI